MLKVGLVGVGGISGAHIPAWESMEEASLVALCDVRPERMERFSNKNCYTDFDEMLEKEKLDILDICLPTYLHADFAVKAMEKGINVITEKPISLKKEDVKRVYDCAEKNNVKFMVAQVLRFWPAYIFVKEAFETKRYGKLLYGNMSRLSAFPAWSWDNWMFDEKRSGLVPYDLHIHDVDYIVYAFGKPMSISSNRIKLPNQDYINAQYKFEEFTINTEAAWYNAPYPFKMEFRFQFENAVIALEDGSFKLYESGKSVVDLQDNSNTDTGSISIPKSNAYADEIKYFAKCVLENKNTDVIKPDELESVIDILNTI